MEVEAVEGQDVVRLGEMGHLSTAMVKNHVL